MIIDFIETAYNTVKAFVCVVIRKWLNPCAEISACNPPACVGNSLRGTINHKLPAYRINNCKQQADKQDIAEGKLCRRRNVFLGKGQTERIRNNCYKQRHTAGYNKSRQKKKYKPAAEAMKNFSVFHFITAL